MKSMRWLPLTLALALLLGAAVSPAATPKKARKPARPAATTAPAEPAAPEIVFPPADPQHIVEVERQFAAHVEALGTKSGFLAYLAPTSVVFRPGPMNGIKAMEAEPVSPAVLAWMPERIVMSSSNDLAFSMGPWAWHPVAHRPASAWGTFVSLWKRMPDGSWKVALDAGVSHARPAADSVDAYTTKLAEPTRSGRGPLAKRQSLWQTDVAFAKFAGDSGVAGAISRYGASEHHRLREDVTPVTGREAARNAAAAADERGTFMSLAQFVSASGDLGYTYGTFVRARGAEIDSSYYVHVWQRGVDKPWELLFDMLLPQPKRAK